MGKEPMLSKTDIQVMAAHLESEIAELLHKFTDATGLRVEKIGISKLSDCPPGSDVNTYMVNIGAFLWRKFPANIAG